MTKDTPLAELTLRKYERPFNLERRDLIKKLCLSLGLLQPGDSRDVIVDVFQVLIDAKAPLTADDIVDLVMKNRARYRLVQAGVAGSNIRRQVRRLKDLFFIEKVQNAYRVAENASLVDIFEEKIEKYYLRTIVDRVKEYLEAVKSPRDPIGNVDVPKV